MLPPAPSDPLAQVVTRLRDARRIAVFTHQRPDPDALGSQAAMVMILRRLGRSAGAVNWEPPPPQYAFLQDGIDTLLFSPAWADANIDLFDTFLVVDTCTYQQLEPATDLLQRAAGKVVAIDHHLSRDPLGPFILADTTAAACVEIIADVAKSLDVPLDAEIATRLLAGLVADTGWFRFDSVTARTHRVAAELVAAGAQPAALYERLQQNETAPKLALIGRALGSLAYAARGSLAVMTLRQQDFKETGATQSQTEEIVNLPLMVGAVEAAALLTELPDGRVRASLRSKHAIDVNAICRQFGGGGHAKAAGCRINGPVESASAAIIAAVEQAIA